MSEKEFTFGFKFAALVGGEFFATFKKCDASISKLNENIAKNKDIIDKINTAQDAGILKMEQATAVVKGYNAEIEKLKNNKSKNLKLELGKSLGATAASYELAKKSFGAIKSVLNIADTAAQFQAGMSKVQAITGATAEDMVTLKNEALKAGQETKFTAMQSADAMSFLGMAGWKTEQIIAGLRPMLDLAAAGNTDLATTADIVSDDLTAFGLSADRAAHMADVYATVMTNSNTNIQMLGETMKYAAPVAKAFGASMEETAALAGAMASNGVKASQAGTSMRAAFLRLAGPPKAAAKALDQMGISLSDVSKEQLEASATLNAMGIDTQGLEGSQKIASVLEQLRAKFKEMSQEEQMAAGKAIFGQNAVTGWLAVINDKSGTYESLMSKLKGLNKAEEEGNAVSKVAGTMMDNAAGKAVAYESAMQTLKITIGNNLLPTLTRLAETGISVASSFGKMASEYPNLISSGLHLAAAVAGLTLAVGVCSTVFNATKTVYLAYTWAVNTNTGALVLNTAKTTLLTGGKILATVAGWGLTAALWAQNAAAYVLAHGIMFTTQVIGLMKTGFIKLFAIIMANPWMALATIAVGAAVLIWQNWDTVKAWFTTLWDNPSLALHQFVDGVKNLLGEVWNWIKEKWESISNLLSKPIFGSVNISKSGDAPTSSNATGGIYGRGAFLTTFAEDSGESAIPHTPNAHNIGLLAKTNEIMGNPLGGSNINATFAPNITVQGAGDTAQLQQVMETEIERFKRMLSELQNQQRRLSYA